jgi:hypothetical protein
MQTGLPKRHLSPHAGARAIGRDVFRSGTRTATVAPCYGETRTRVHFPRHLARGVVEPREHQRYRLRLIQDRNYDRKEHERIP